MKVYVGQARGSKLIARLTELGFGEMTVREEYPPRRKPWAFDNGAFKDFKAGVAFGEKAFEKAVEKIRKTDDRPDFLVVPDVVEGGLASLEFSRRWCRRLDGLAPLFLSVQDGMATVDVQRTIELERRPDEMTPFDGLFVGGSLRWKIATGARWVEFAHARGMKCHIGRVGTFKRTRWAQRIGVDSIDSCLPLWSEENLRAFLRAFEPNHQLEMAL